MTNSIETVIFDFGNVFCIWDPFRALEDKYTEAEWLQFTKDVNLDKLVEEWDAGASHKDTLGKIALVDADLGTNWAALFEHFAANFAKTITYQLPGMPELVEDLQALGIKTYGLTNWSPDDFPTAKKNVRGIALMQGEIVSGYEKITKPNPEIYQLLFDRFNVDPKTAVFMDDRLENVQAAEKFGVHGLHLTPPFENNAQVARECLTKLGVFA